MGGLSRESKHPHYSVQQKHIVFQLTQEPTTNMISLIHFYNTHDRVDIYPGNGTAMLNLKLKFKKKILAALLPAKYLIF